MGHITYIQMPAGRGYKRYTKKRRNPNNVKKYLGYASSVAGTAAKALTIAMAVKRMVNVEYKCIDIKSITNLIPNGSGLIIQCTNSQQGDTATSRDGNQIKLTAWNFRATIIANSNASTLGITVTILLIEDRQTNGAIYTTADVIADVTDSISQISPLNIDGKFRFRVLKRWTFNVNATSAKPRVELKYYHRFGDKMKVRYDGNVGDITDLSSRSLSILRISDAVTADEPTFRFFSRVRFVDN